MFNRVELEEAVEIGNRAYRLIRWVGDAVEQAMVNVNYEDLREAFDFVSFGGGDEHLAYVSLDTGAIYWILEDSDEELPSDIETSDRYVTVPHKNDLDLGRNLALRFASAELSPARYEDICEAFHRRGAYARFKDILARENRLEDWYRFEEEATEKALKEWCESVGLQPVQPAT